MAAEEWNIHVVDDALAEVGPGPGRPLVDTLSGSTIANLKELRPGTVRIPLAEQRYEIYLKERAQQEEGQ